MRVSRVPSFLVKLLPERSAGEKLTCVVTARMSGCTQPTPRSMCTLLDMQHASMMRSADSGDLRNDVR